MREKFYAELSRRLRDEGIESSYAGTQNLSVSLHGQPVLCVTPSSEIYILPAGSKNEEVNDLYHRVGATADEVYEYVEAVQSSPLLRASDLKEEFRLLADFGCAVLAGRECENDRGYTHAKTARQIRQVTEHLDQFDFAPGVHTPEEYGRYMIRDSGHFDYDSNLDEFYDYGKYGRQHLEQSQGMFTEQGYWLCSPKIGGEKHEKT